MEKAPARNWDWLTAGLLFLLMQVAAARLVTTDWTPNLYFAESLAAFGTALGLALGVSRFGRKAVTWLAIAYTGIVLPWQMTGAASEKLFLDRLQHIGRVLFVSMGQFTQRQPVKDPLFFVAFVCLVFWIISVLAGYRVARYRNVLVGMIPSAIILLLIQIYANYQPHSSWWLAVYILIALLLIGRVYYLQSERTWSERRVFVNDEAWSNIMGGLFMTVAVTLLIAWLLPTSISSVQAATDAWTNMTRGVRDRLSNAVTSLTGPNGKPGVNFYSANLPLGQNAAVGDSPVFNVEVLDAPASNLRYYWRGRVYDNYSNGQWTDSPAATLDFQPPAGNLKVLYPNGRSLAQLRFTLQFPTQSLIYAPSEPVWIDRAANVQTAPAERGLNDILSWQAKKNIPGGNRYEVRSEIANPDVRQLRAAPAFYPQWIQDRYLEIPAGLRPKFQALAEKVTAGQKSPYDKAAAITSYLRFNLRYSLNIPSAPEGRDPVEWVLFSYKQGFCNYYASAEVLMLRSIGIPARLAVGFAQGEYRSGTYIVRRRDAHAWPEVFFPDIGWVEFEPTVSQQPLIRNDPSIQPSVGPLNGPLARPLEDGDQQGPNKPVTPAGSPGVPFARTLAGRALRITLYLMALGLLGYLLYRYRAFAFVPVVLSRAFESSGVATPAWIVNWSSWNRLNPVEQAFASINWSLRWLGRPARVDATPAERAASLRQVLPQALEHIDIVASELETGLFTPQPADAARARKAGFFLLLHALRAALFNRMSTLGGGRDAYSR
jgi:hypothetical protein